MDKWFKQIEELWEQLHQRLERVAADRWSCLALHSRHMKHSRLQEIFSHYTGLFKIPHQINMVTYSLDPLCHSHLSSLFHISQLKPVTSGPLDTDYPPATPTTPMEMGCQPVHTLKQLLRSWLRCNRLEYLVNWEGYGPKECCWVLTTIPATAAEFHDQHPDQPGQCP